MAINSRAKGKIGELSLAKVLREYGFEARRGGQYSGANGDPDVVTSMTDLHIECKRVERLDIYGAVEQSCRDAREGETPVVMHRKNRKPWLVTMRLEDFIDMYRRKQ